MSWCGLFEGRGEEGNAANNLRISTIMKRDFSKGTNGVISCCVRHCCGGLCRGHRSNGRADLRRNHPVVLVFIIFLAIKNVAFFNVKKPSHRIVRVPASTVTTRRVRVGSGLCAPGVGMAHLHVTLLAAGGGDHHGAGVTRAPWCSQARGSQSRTVWPRSSLRVSDSGRAQHAEFCIMVKTVKQATGMGTLQAAAANDA